MTPIKHYDRRTWECKTIKDSLGSDVCYGDTAVFTFRGRLRKGVVCGRTNSGFNLRLVTPDGPFRCKPKHLIVISRMDIKCPL